MYIALYVICFQIYNLGNLLVIAKYYNSDDKFQTKYYVFMKEENQTYMDYLDTVASSRISNLNLRTSHTSRSLKNYPNLTLQTSEEADYLQFHRCFGKFNLLNALKMN